MSYLKVKLIYKTLLLNYLISYCKFFFFQKYYTVFFNPFLSVPKGSCARYTNSKIVNGKWYKWCKTFYRGQVPNLTGERRAARVAHNLCPSQTRTTMGGFRVWWGAWSGWGRVSTWPKMFRKKPLLGGGTWPTLWFLALASAEWVSGFFVPLRGRSCMHFWWRNLINSCRCKLVGQKGKKLFQMGFAATRELLENWNENKGNLIWSGKIK